MTQRAELSARIKALQPTFRLNPAHTAEDLLRYFDAIKNDKATLPALSDEMKLPRVDTKAHLVLEGLVDTGLTVADIMKVTGWKREAAYGAIHEDVRRRYGFKVTRKHGVYHAKMPKRLEKEFRSAG